MLVIACALVICATFSIVASAEESSPAVVETGSESVALPKIASKNLSYASQLYIYFAVPASDVPTGATISLRLYDAAPEGGGNLIRTVTAYSKQVISSIGVDPGATYYVFSSHGIAPRQISEYIYAVPVLTIGDTEIVGVTEKYSVAEYCYDRLYNQDFISKTASDGEDYNRKQLYLSLLNYGDAAQLHFGTPDAALTSNFTYYNIKQALVADNSGFCTPGDTVALVHDGTTKVGMMHYGWQVTYYDENNVKTVERYFGAEYVIMSIIYAAKATIAEPIWVVDDPYAAQVAEDEAMLAAKWAALEQTTGKEIADALKQTYDLFGDDIVEWSAGLYAPGYSDPENGYYAGGYYAAVSGRDNLGFGPDVESTYQMINFIVKSGMLAHEGITDYDDANDRARLRYVLPEWMQQQIVHFIKSLQHEDGYFYHPQWAVADHSDRRLGRDLGWARSLLSIFLSGPVYDTPDNKKGDGITAEAYLESLGYSSAAEANAAFFAARGASNAVAMSLRSSARSAVSGVMLVATITTVDSITDAVSSHENLEIWLENKIKLDVDPYSYGDQLNSVYVQIGAASDELGKYTANSSKWYYGMTLKDMTIAYVNSFIDDETGLIDDGWRDDEGRTGDEFVHTNGLLKISSLYQNWGYQYPYPMAAATSTINGILGDEQTDNQITDIYNMWCAINFLKRNAGADGLAASPIKNGTPITVSEEEKAATVEYIATRLGENALFAITNSYEKLARFKKPDGGFNAGVYSGAGASATCPTSLGLSNESLCDPTQIAISTVHHMMSAFGYTVIPFFTESDWMRYIEIIRNAQPITKGDFNNAEYSFDDGNVPADVTSENASLGVADGALTLSGASNAALSVARHSICSLGKVIKFGADMKFTSTGDYALTFNTEEGVAVSFTIRVESAKVTLIDDLSGTDYNMVAALGSTVSIKFETSIRYNSTDGKNYIVTDAFLGNNYCGIISSFVTADAYDSIEALTEIKTASLNTPAGTVSLDNLIFVIGNSSAPADFESTQPFEMVGKASVTSGAITTSLAPRKNTDAKFIVMRETVNGLNNTFVRVNNATTQTGDGASTVTLSAKSPYVKGNTLVVQARIRIDNTNNRGAFEINLTGVGSLKPCAIRITPVSNGNDTLYFYTDHAILKDSTKNLYPADGQTSLGAYGAAQGQWFTVKFVITTGENKAFQYDVYVNDTKLNSTPITKTYTQNHELKASQIDTLSLYAESGWIGTVDIDDVSFTTLAN